MAPPPKMSASRRSTSVNTPTAAINSKPNNNIVGNGNMADLLFDSDPFAPTTITPITNGTSIFPKQVSKISVDDFTLESLDPFRK